MTLIETVARAVAEADGNSPEDWREYEDLVVAALTATKGYVENNKNSEPVSIGN